MERPTNYMPDPEMGLTGEQVRQRKCAGLPKPAGKSVREIFLTHCFTFFNLIFLLLAALLVLGRSTVLNMGFLMVAAINTVIGIVQELRAKRAVDALTLVARRPVRVIREGKRLALLPEELVREDIVEFSQGDTLCADGIVRTGQLWVDESLITGEADPVEKAEGSPVRSGTVVLAGRGRVQLTAVGEDAFAARLSREAKHNPAARKSEMMRALDKLILAVGIALVPVGLMLFYQEYAVLQLSLRDSVEGTVAALVGMIPEGLYLLTSIALAASALKLSRERVLVQDVSCIEALARVDVLCVDKTGTITEGDMVLEQVLPLEGAEPDYPEAVLTAMYGAVEPDNATARAIHHRFRGESDWKAVKRIPFTPEAKWSAAVFEEKGAFLAGAPEILLGSAMARYRRQVEAWTETGSRVLLLGACGRDVQRGSFDPEQLKPLAFLVFRSRIRETAEETFAYFTRQGVSVRVLSGDDPRTASEVAHRAGIPGAKRYVDAAALEEKDYETAVETYVVFGRVTPEQKRRLVAALQKRGHTVGMTGDGVNDLLAMKQADCSVAMASGAQAASQLASLVLLDSEFAAMPGIVAEGRRVINNIQRSAALFLVKNIFSLFLSVLTLVTQWPYPLEPVHLTVIGALTIGIPSFFLAMEPNYAHVRGRFLPGVLRRAFPGGLTNVCMVLLCQALARWLRLPAGFTPPACAAILAMVGLLVLLQVCRPWSRFRNILWCAMLLGILGAFSLLGRPFRLLSGSRETELAMAALLLITPVVFFAMQRLFSLGEGICSRVLKKLQNPG